MADLDGLALMARRQAGLPAMLAAADGAATAIAGLEQRLDFTTLARLLRQVAWRVGASVPPGGVVATALPHTPNGIAAVLGCVHSGRTCILLNPLDPPARNMAILEDAAPALLVGTAEGWQDARLTLEDALAGDPPPPGWTLPQLAADFPAAVHFTSGSTGRPKGIAFAIEGVLARCDDGTAMGPQDRVLATGLHNTSAGLCHVMKPLLNGARVLAATLSRDGAGAVLRLAQREGATVLSAGPAVMRMLSRLPAAAEAFATLRLVRVGGAPLPWEDFLAWRRVLPPGCAVQHRYASTEAGFVAQWLAGPDRLGEARDLPIGHWAGPHMRALLDADGREAPEGELVLRGPAMALGEWLDGRLVTGRMLPDPAHPGWRVFRTGDLFGRDQHGLLRFLGRADRQLKINEVRIEPAEIEAVLRRQPGVTEAAVVVRQRPQGVLLHGFVAAPDADADTLVPQLAAALRRDLPPAMRPSRLSVLPALALASGGKLDMRALALLSEQADET